MPHKSDLEELYLKKLLDTEIIPPVRQYKFLDTRKFKFDFAWPQFFLAVEIEGGIWSGGRHINPMGFTKDAEKYNLAAINGWYVLRFVSEHVKNGKAIEWTSAFFDKITFIE